MAQLPPTYEFGEVEDLEEMLRQIQNMYSSLAVAINRKPDIVQRDTDGQTDDTFLSNGTMNINTTSLKVEMLTEHTDPSTVVWTTLS